MLLGNVFLARHNNQFSMPYYQCMVLQCMIGIQWEILYLKGQSANFTILHI